MSIAPPAPAHRERLLHWPKRRLSAAALAGAGLLVLLAPSSIAAWAAGTFSSTSETRLVELTNQARANAGLGRLVVDSTLWSVARSRSKDMIDRNYFSHSIPPDGHSVFTELKARGYCMLSAGENIGWNTYPDETATQVIHDMWMNSSGHRANILGSSYRVIGVGAYQGSTSKKMWTVLFANPCSMPVATPTPTPIPTPTPTPTPAPAPSPATFVALNPNRILDSRSGVGLSGRFRTGVPRTFQVTERNNGEPSLNIPSTAIAVTGNLTVTGQTRAGWLTLGPFPQASPPTSTLNFPAGDTRANGVTVRLGPGGTLALVYNGAGGLDTTHAVFDVTGYFLPGTSGATYATLTPSRVLDTRVANGLAGVFQVNIPRTFQVTDRSTASASLNVPSTAIAVTGNLTVTGQTAPGWLTVTPARDTNARTSTLNFPMGDSRANGLTVQLGTGGTLSVVYQGAPTTATTHVVFDVTGYFLPGSSGARYVPLTPNRLLDSRVGNGLSGSFLAGTARSFKVADRAVQDPSRNVPTSAIAVTGNLTVADQTQQGWLTVTPVLMNNPPTSTLNFPVGDTRANGLAGRLGSGSLSVVYNGGYRQTTHAVFDVTGFFAP